jgi:phosphatidylserine decarboxylase
VPIAREAWPFVAVLGGLGVACGVLRWPWPAGILALLALFTLYFFRDPERATPAGERLVISPADGKVVRVVEVDETPLGGPGHQISIFLSIFDVHINRAPIAGVVRSVEYHTGEFLPAFDHSASHRNERNVVVIEGERGDVAFAQIAGLIARRIVFRPAEGDRVERGGRVGLIKFGSRVDVFLPPASRVLVRVGERVQSGATPIGELE